MTLIAITNTPIVYSCEVFNVNEDGFCPVVIVYKVLKDDQWIYFPVTTLWPPETTLSDGDLHDEAAMNDVLALYGYVLS